MAMKIEILKIGALDLLTISSVKKFLKIVLSKFSARTLNSLFYTAIIYLSESYNYIMGNISLTSNPLRTSVKESIFFPIYFFFSDMDLPGSFSCPITIFIELQTQFSRT